MSANSRFTTAVHALCWIELSTRHGRPALTSAEIADSLASHPVLVRRILAPLRDDGTLRVTGRGPGAGWRLGRPAAEISLLDVHRSLAEEGPFALHSHEPKQDCPVGFGIRPVLAGVYARVEDAIARELRSSTIAGVLDGLLRDHPLQHDPIRAPSGSGSPRVAAPVTQLVDDAGEALRSGADGVRGEGAGHLGEYGVDAAGVAGGDGGATLASHSGQATRRCHPRPDGHRARTEHVGTFHSLNGSGRTMTQNPPEVASREEWLTARKKLLNSEKELTQARDRVNAERRRLPMVRVDKPYAFEGPDGTVGLPDLFEGRPQLVVHHFMFDPEWDHGCPSCSSAADGIGHLRQLHVRNTTLVAISRAPYPKLTAFRQRMGWTFPWYSSHSSDFNYDFHATLDDRVAPVLLHLRTEAELAEAGTPWTGGPWTPDMRGTEMPGVSAFLQVDNEVFHTYSTYGRGIEDFHNGYPHLDLTALGRQEAWEEPKGRALPLGLQVGGPALRLPDQYNT